MQLHINLVLSTCSCQLYLNYAEGIGSSVDSRYQQFININKLDDFKFTGLNNFDFFSTKLSVDGFGEEESRPKNNFNAAIVIKNRSMGHLDFKAQLMSVRVASPLK